jgi:translation initiation factor 2 alpha subunit (eIF-2alpha)
MVWKKERKAEALLRSVAEKTGMTMEEIHEKAGKLLENEYGLYEGLEKAVKEGPEILAKVGVPAEIAKAIIEVVQERIRVPMIKIKGTVELRCMKPNGVKIIKEAFADAKKGEKLGNAKLRFYVVAAPKYSIEVMAEDYKHAEDILQKVAQNVVSNVSKAGGQGTFRREK